MRVYKVFPCVCIDHIPNSGDSVSYGMPELKVSGGLGEKAYWFTPCCPNCERGGQMQFKSAYLALKAWNELQMELWKLRLLEETKKTGTLFGDQTEHAEIPEESAISIEEYRTLLREMRKALEGNKKNG